MDATHEILKHRQNQGELLAILREMEQRGLKVISLEDKDTDGRTIPLAEIDPFSFLATFNRGVTDRNRRENWAFLKSRWNLKAPVPEDFCGVPVLNNMRCRLMPWAKARSNDHVELLWQIAAMAADGGPEQVDPAAFDACLNLPLVGMASLTIGLSWINPEKFLSADSKNLAYGEAKGITTVPVDFGTYGQWLKEMTGQLGSDFPKVSHQAQLFATEAEGEGDGAALHGALPQPPAESAGRHYWTLSAGAGGEHWDEFHEKGIAAIGWDGTPNLRDFKSKEELRQKLLELWPGDSSKKNDALACRHFAHDIEVGDIIFDLATYDLRLCFLVTYEPYHSDDSPLVTCHPLRDGAPAGCPIPRRDRGAEEDGDR